MLTKAFLIKFSHANHGNQQLYEKLTASTCSCHGLRCAFCQQRVHKELVTQQDLGRSHGACVHSRRKECLHVWHVLWQKHRWHILQTLVHFCSVTDELRRVDPVRPPTACWRKRWQLAGSHRIFPVTENQVKGAHKKFNPWFVLVN